METYTSKLISELLDAISPIDQAKTDAKMLIAAKIADAIEAKGWKHKDLLEALGKTNASVISKWLSGTHNFTVDTLVELEHALEIQILNLEEAHIRMETKTISINLVVGPKEAAMSGFTGATQMHNTQNSYSFKTSQSSFEKTKSGALA
jgi:transcriptional regulator with XRE-family HTH domain